ncbi:hypothetical protein [Arthrobacter sp. H35-D1]|uniref:hypothetical protein n=1 Tax=Arthrobacter sp. H35-D1 TaxID=3046202 RepID=UPI0024BAAC16|nr:hypothetical protein [Arthrobacter sp. H35-D1]MDJ0314168.1 hypothetical protein [Arthrobacter sp. H35-D1]
MRKVTNLHGFDPSKNFFSLPLAQAREIASRVVVPVVAQAAETGELLNVRGHEVLRDALAGEFPSLSADGLFSLAEEVAGTACMIATVEWRKAGYRPGDSPTVGLSALAGALLIHLYASPESLPAQLCVATWDEHATLYKHSNYRPPHPTKDAMRQWAQLGREHQQSMYEYWQALQANP